MQRKRDPYIAIMVAAAHGRGIHLTADEVGDLCLDDAISTRAANALERPEHEKMGAAGFLEGWSAVDPLPAARAV